MRTKTPARRWKARLQCACQVLLELAFVAGILVGLFFPILLVHAGPSVSLYDEASAQTSEISQQDALPMAIGLPPVIFPRADVTIALEISPARALSSPTGGRAPPVG